MLSILSSSPFCSVQDAGRPGWARFGLPAAGPMDPFAHAAANLLVGNAGGAAALEIGLGGLALRSDEDCLVAVTGPGIQLRRDGQWLSAWTSHYLPRGVSLEVERSGPGVWAYLAVAGGFLTPLLMGSRSTYLPAGLGTRLQPGDELPIAPQSADLSLRAGLVLPREARLSYSLAPRLGVLPGPHVGHFAAGALDDFFSGSFTVSLTSDRTGYRLDGPPVAHNDAGADILSTGTLPGCVQVPASGQPMVLMADAPTSGGYTLIASLSQRHRAVLAQIPPGEGQIRFVELTLGEAQAMTWSTWREMRAGIQQDDGQAIGWVGF
jgi:antagonist of KipI